MDRSRYRWHVAFIGFATCLWIAVIGCASLMRWETYVQGSGRVESRLGVQRIQAPDDARVSEIYVHLGDVVEKGAPLMKLVDLDGGQQEKTAGALSQKMDALATIDRLKVEESNAEPIWSPEIVDPSVIARHLAILETSRRKYVDERNALQATMRSAKAEITGSNQRISSAAQTVAPLERKYQQTREGQATGASTSVGLSSAEAELMRAKDTLNSEQSRAGIMKAKVEEAEAQLKSLESRRSATIADARGKAELELTKARDLLSAGEGRTRERVIVAPVAGSILQLIVTGSGEAPRRGTNLVEMTRSDDTLVLVAKLKAADIRGVKPGLEGNVKIGSYDYARFGTVPGRVTLISPDVIREQDNFFYRTEIDFDRTTVSKDGLYPIKAGMSADVDILMGESTLLDIFFGRIYRATSETFRTR
jgi:adhesin transport system membrane fusion protein